MLRALLLLTIASLAAAYSAPHATGKGAPPATGKDPEWEAFKKKYKKSYKDADDEAARHGMFKTAQARVAQLNQLNGKAGAAFGINWMSDRYESEKYKKGLKKPKDFVPTAPVMEWDLAARKSPKSINWRYTEAVTPIKNQGQCGSCWAFSATEAVESQMILGTGSALATALSPQQVASCTPATGTYGCMGCEGGFTEGAYEYLKTAPGLANSFFIPYEQSLTEQTATAACPTTKVQAITGELEQLQGGYAQVTGYSYAVPPCTGTCSGASQDLAKFAQALETTPLSVCVNAENWNDYTGGVMSAAACGPSGAQYQDHCVMATGFNTTAPTPYWIVRNSWASTWGEEGYVYLEMSKNTCGLADDATIPHVKLDLTPEQEAKAAARREAMYQRATMAH
jgi:C1A family cysteine protease